MKRILVFLAAGLMHMNVWAQNDTSGVNTGTNLNWKNNYCASLENGNLAIRNQGNPLTSDVTLENGTIITTDGIVIKTDGTRRTLTEGECVDKNGNIAPKSEMKKIKDANK